MDQSQRVLDINVISAKDLKDVNLVSKMEVYVVVSISSQHNSDHKSIPDRDGGIHPTWNHAVKLLVDGASREMLIFRLKCKRSLGDKDVGEVKVPVNELLDVPHNGNTQFVTYQVRTPSGKAKGSLNFSYRFGEKLERTKPIPNTVPVIAYPPTVTVGPSSGYPYPPPQTVAGYPYLPQTSGYPCPQSGYYPYPPPMVPQAGYSYPPQAYGYPAGADQKAKKNRNKMGMGLGAGILGGAVGGMLIGDMLSDDSGFNGGFEF